MKKNDIKVPPARGSDGTVTLTTDTPIDGLLSIYVDTTTIPITWPKRHGLLKVEQRGEEGTQYSLSASRHIANEPDQPEWPQFRFATSDIVGLVVASVLALPPIALLGWIIFGGLS